MNWKMRWFFDGIYLTPTWCGIWVCVKLMDEIYRWQCQWTNLWWTHRNLENSYTITAFSSVFLVVSLSSDTQRVNPPLKPFGTLWLFCWGHGWRFGTIKNNFTFWISLLYFEKSQANEISNAPWHVNPLFASTRFDTYPDMQSDMWSDMLSAIPQAVTCIYSDMQYKRV